MSAPDKQTPKVLIVDDIPANLDVLSQILSSEAYEVQQASSGEEALKLVLNQEFACCLLDIRMPGMDGFQTAEFIRRDTQIGHLPIIFVTAEVGDQATLFKGYEKGAVDFLFKPLEPSIIRSKVAVFVDLYSYRKALERTHEIEALNRKLEKLNHDLLATNDDLRHFTQMAAHDLREPIRVQKNLTELLIEAIPQPYSESTQTLLNGMTKCSNRMLAMLEDFRALSQIDDIKLTKTPIHLNTVIQACLDDFSDRIQSRNVKVQLDPCPDHVLVYSGLVTRFYENMIKNIFDHVHSDGFLIHFTAEKEGKEWVFGLMNTGSTIKKEHFVEVFKMFRTFDPQFRQGTGVGLSICKKIIDRHGGRISIDAGADKVHFKFTFGNV